jgi:hypothetical protein
MTTKDAKILRVAIVPAFILASIIGAIAILSFSISEAITPESRVNERDQVALERALAGSELADNSRGFMEQQ